MCHNIVRNIIEYYSMFGIEVVMKIVTEYFEGIFEEYEIYYFEF